MTGNTPLKKDWFVLGFATGAIASTVKTGLNVLMDHAGIETTSYPSMSSGVILGKKIRVGGLLSSRPRNFGEWAVGYIADAIGGGLIGTAMSYIYLKTPPGNEVLKGAIGGAAFWAGTLTIGRHLRVGGFEKATPAKMISLLGTSLAYGALQGWMIGKWGASLIEQSHPLLVKPVSGRSFDRGRFRPDYLNRAR